LPKKKLIYWLLVSEPTLLCFGSVTSLLESYLIEFSLKIGLNI